jgi:hypothetical protein
MTLNSTLQIFLVGFFGGLLLELVHWYALFKQDRSTTFIRNPVYWVISLLMAVAGGGLAVLYFGSRAEGIVALHVGLSAPLILQKLVTTVADVPGAKGPGAGVIDFFKW